MFNFSFVGYQLIFTKQAEKSFSNLEKSVAIFISDKLKKLLEGKENHNVKKLFDDKCKLYRLHCGHYRVVFHVNRGQLIIIVIWGRSS